ncbi:hypothetical protein OPT61_g7985 [Boeremia exigua]|uniref:Uncharacterized protein n=1 Tax=Boeremia exigua TaxID=749465 RepID=A0ACC2I159_9PLEO|nr:hypothetical protein OPT61_g7985 [Boeremia exigua]
MSCPTSRSTAIFMTGFESRDAHLGLQANHAGSAVIRCAETPMIGSPQESVESLSSLLRHGRKAVSGVLCCGFWKAGCPNAVCYPSSALSQRRVVGYAYEVEEAAKDPIDTRLTLGELRGFTM